MRQDKVVVAAVEELQCVHAGLERDVVAGFGVFQRGDNGRAADECVENGVIRRKVDEAHEPAAAFARVRHVVDEVNGKAFVQACDGQRVDAAGHELRCFQRDEDGVQPCGRDVDVVYPRVGRHVFGERFEREIVSHEDIVDEDIHGGRVGRGVQQANVRGAFGVRHCMESRHWNPPSGYK